MTRFGGEEFAAILPETEARGAAHLADKMREAVEALALPHAGSEVQVRVVTISAGIASTEQNSDGSGQSDLLQWTDAALYEAKRQGRNRVVSYALGPSQA